MNALRLLAWFGAAARQRRGQGLVEYGLMLSLMAVVAVLTLVFFGSEVSTVLDVIARAVDTPG